MSGIKFGRFRIGEGSRALVLAEAGVNHNGDPRRAHELIDAAAGAGADIIKFQTFVTEELVTRGTAKAAYQQSNSSSSSQHEMLKSLELPTSLYRSLINHCEDRGIVFLSTPYDLRSIDFLDSLDVVGFKVASTDTTNLPFLRYLGATGRPILMSTGMCSLSEVDSAMSSVREGGATSVVLLHCTSEYPAPVEEANLNAMVSMGAAFQCPVGFSDHTEGLLVAPWAICLGAKVIEKHFTLDRTLPGPDHKASLEPGELAAFVRTVRLAEVALGDGIKRVMPSELDNKSLMQKSLVASQPIEKDQVIEEHAITCKRPGTGLQPGLLHQVVGRRASRRIEADEVITLGAVRWD